MINKILSPFVYGLFFFPTVIGTIALITFIERNFGFHTIYRVGDIDFVVILATFGLGVLWIGNKIIHRIEKPVHFSIADHVRQSSLYYLGFLASATTLVVAYREHNGGLGYGMLAMGCVVCLLAIGVNARYLLRKKTASTQL